MAPWLGVSSRLIIRNSVDFPAPERPITPMKRPASICNETLSTAALAPKRRETLSMTSMVRPFS